MTTTYATKLTPAYLAQRAAAAAGGDPIDFLTGALILGDGGGSVPTLSALLAADGVLNEVWRGNVIVAVEQNADNAAQFDIKTVIPAAVGGVEVGPFWVREFAVVDAAGVCLVVGTTEFQKTTSGEGMPSDASLIIGIGESNGDVLIVSPGSSSFATEVQVRTFFNANLPDSTGAIEKTDTTVSGWVRRVFSLRKARQPSAEVGSVVLEADAFGGGRPATDAEFAAGVAAVGSSFTWPWPTLAQIKTALASIVPYGVNAPLTKNDTTKKYAITNGSQAAVGALRLATSGEVTARTTNPTNGPCAVRPEDIPVVPVDPWGTGVGAIVEIPGSSNITGTIGSGPVGQSVAGSVINAGGTLGGVTWPACSAPSAAPSGDIVQWADARQGAFTGSWQCIQFRNTFLHETGIEPSGLTNVTIVFKRVS